MAGDALVVAEKVVFRSSSEFEFHEFAGEGNPARFLFPLETEFEEAGGFLVFVEVAVGLGCAFGVTAAVDGFSAGFLGDLLFPFFDEGFESVAVADVAVVAAVVDRDAR